MDEPSPTRRALRLPPRPRGAETATELFARTEKLSFPAFEAAVFEAIAGGNVPSFERELVRVDVSGEVSGTRVPAAIFVLCDYLAVGSDEDFVRMPLTPGTAQRVASLTDASLPTPKIVDAIYHAAPSKLAPHPMTGDGDTVQRRLILAHHRAIEAERTQRGVPLGSLLVGTKKDLVISAALAQHPDHVGIYGWHKEDGEPVQPLSWMHARTYSDYSHGLRLVDQHCEIDGRSHRLGEVLRDPRLASLVSAEGALSVTEFPL